MTSTSSGLEGGSELRPNCVIVGTGVSYRRLDEPALDRFDGSRRAPLQLARLELSPSALFVLIGAEPPTQWLEGCVQLDQHGFSLTGRDLSPPAASSPRGERRAETPMRWRRARPACTRRVTCAAARSSAASAVGVGSVAVRMVSEHLAPRTSYRSGAAS
jgi:hypothetical protein